MSSPIISVIINGHLEGELASVSIKNLIWCVEYAVTQGISVESIAILDAPDKKTVAVFNRFSHFFDHIKIIEERDLSRARNKGIQLATGKYIAFIDADDLWYKNWLPACVRFFKDSGADNMVLHADYSMYFDAKYICRKHEDSLQMDADQISSLIFFHPWTAIAFAPRAVFFKHNYADANIASGFGYEDWHWNCEVLADGIEHRVVPETVHLVRCKRYGSLWKEHDSALSTLRPTALFDQTERMLMNPVHDYRQTPTLPEPVVFPQYVMDAMQEMAQFDEKIFPTPKRLQEMSYFPSRYTNAGRIYAHIRQHLGNQAIDTVFLGNTDKAMLSAIQSVLHSHAEARMVVIATNPVSSAPTEHLPTQALFFNLRDLCGEEFAEYLPLILLRLLIQLHPETIHVIESDAGWQLIRDYGKALRSLSRLVASIKSGGISAYLPQCLEYLEKVYTDDLNNVYALLEERGFPDKESKITLADFVCTG